jgi:hypothetical protein
LVYHGVGGLVEVVRHKTEQVRELRFVMNPLCPPSNAADDGSIAALKRRACDFTCQQMTSAYYEDDQEDEGTLAIARLVSADMPTMGAQASLI